MTKVESEADHQTTQCALYLQQHKKAHRSWSGALVACFLFDVKAYVPAGDSLDAGARRCSRRT